MTTVGVTRTGVSARLHVPVLTAIPHVTAAPVRLPRVAENGTVDGGAADRLSTALSGLDLFVLGSPPYCHRAHGGLILQAGIPMLCEKPAGLDAGEAEELSVMASRHRREFRVNYQLRFDPLVRLAREFALDSKVLARVIVCRSGARRSRANKPSWYWNSALGGGVTSSLLSHLIDTAHFLGAEPAVMNSVRSRQKSDMQAPDKIEVHAHCSDGSSLLLVADGLAEETILSIGIRTATSTTYFDLVRGGIAQNPDLRNPLHGHLDPRPFGPWRAAFTHCMDYVLAEPGKVNLGRCADLEDAVRVHYVMSAAYSCLRDGNAVAVRGAR
ncbi:Gfo/Idh/MocA family protein [Streptomyces antimycoticus]